MCGAWWDDRVEKESYIQEKGKIVSGVGLCEEHSYFMHRREGRGRGRA